MAEADEKKQAYPLIGVDPDAKPAELDYETITDKELIALMKMNAKEVLVIDVRDPDKDGDFLGGNIKGAMNIPTYNFVDQLPNLITEENVAEKKTVVFLCMMSKGRGPQTYRLYDKAREFLGKDKKDADDADKDDGFTKEVSKIKLSDKGLASLKAQKVAVLKGGFHTFLNYHMEEKDLIENFDKSFWEQDKLSGVDNEGLAWYHVNEQ
eukprot:26183_1